MTLATCVHDPRCFQQRPPEGIDLGHLLPAMLRQFEDGGLRYVVMRNYEGFPHWGYKPDVGLLIDHRDASLLVDLFQKACDELGYVFIPATASRNNVVLFAVRAMPDANDGGQFDAVKVDARTYESFALGRWHRRLRPFNYKVFLDDTRRRRVVQDDCAFHVYDQHDDFIMLFKQWRRKGHNRYRNALIERLKDAQLLDWFCGTIGVKKTEPERLIGPVYDESTHDPWVLRMLQRRYGRSTPWRMIVTHWRALAVALRQMRPHAAALIYFTGPDGCGKSTVLEYVKRILSDGSIIEPVKFRHLYSLKNVLVHVTQRFAWLKSARRPGRPGDASNDANPAELVLQRVDNMTVRDRDPGTKGWRIRKLIALLVGLLDIRVSYLVAWSFRWCGIVVLVETSPYDVFIKYHMPEFPWVERLFAPLLPRPNVCLVLRANAERIATRKPELTVGEVTDFYERIDRVIRRAGANNSAVSIPTDVAPDLTFTRAAAEVIHQIGLARIGAQPSRFSANDP